MNPEVREVFLKRSKLIQSMRQFMDAHGFIEVETPMMQPIAGGAVARPFVTHHNTLDMDLYLRIAPELYLKRLTVGGFDRVYEINRNFRNEGLGWRWNPEFTMLESYQAYTDYRGIMDLTQQLIIQAAKDVTGGTKTKWGEDEIDWAESNWQRLTMREAIIQFWPEGRVEPKASRCSEFRASALRRVRRAGRAASTPHSAHSGLRSRQGDLPEKTIAALFEAVAEEHLIQPTIIYEFPTAISPLSKQKPDEPDWTERWEIFAGKMEIANGFSELNDPEDQRRRFEQQLKERERGDEEAHQMDEDYIRALSYGMPPAGGVGVGVDRLAMLLTDSHTIRDVILFPLLRPEKKTTEGTEDTVEAAAEPSVSPRRRFDVAEHSEGSLHSFEMHRFFASLRMTTLLVHSLCFDRKLRIDLCAFSCVHWNRISMRFDFDSATRRKLGYRLIDQIDAFFSSLPDRPVQLPAERAHLWSAANPAARTRRRCGPSARRSLPRDGRQRLPRSQRQLFRSDESDPDLHGSAGGSAGGRL